MEYLADQSEEVFEGSAIKIGAETNKRHRGKEDYGSWHEGEEKSVFAWKASVFCLKDSR